MSEYAIYKMFDGCDAPYNIEFCGHLIGSRVAVGTCDKDPVAFLRPSRATATLNGWHTEPPKDGRLVLCQGKRGSIFVGSLYKANEHGMEFYVPSCTDNYRYAIAWHELPRPYGGGANGTD